MIVRSIDGTPNITIIMQKNIPSNPTGMDWNQFLLNGYVNEQYCPHHAIMLRAYVEVIFNFIDLYSGNAEIRNKIVEGNEKFKKDDYDHLLIALDRYLGWKLGGKWREFKVKFIIGKFTIEIGATQPNNREHEQRKGNQSNNGGWGGGGGGGNTGNGRKSRNRKRGGQKNRGAGSKHNIQWPCLLFLILTMALY
jgi:hypothetical protein